MSRILTVVRHDVRRAFRDRTVWAAILLVGAAFLPSVGAVADPEFNPLLDGVLLVVLELATFSLLVVVAVGYRAVVGERTGGTIRFVLGLPAARREVVVGKLLGRVTVAGVVLAGLLTVAGVVVVRGYGIASLVPYLVASGWLIAYAAVWTAVTVGYSAAFDSSARPLGAVLLTYLTFSFDFGVWRVLIRPAFALLFTGSFDAPVYDTLATAPLWLRVTERLNPLVNFWEAMVWSVETAVTGTPPGSALPHLLGTVYFLSVGAVVLVWGTRRFERADLGTATDGPALGDRLWRAVGNAVDRVSRETGGTTAGESRVRSLSAVDRRHALQSGIVSVGIVVTLLSVAPTLWGVLGPSSVSTPTERLLSVPSVFTLPVLVLGIALGHGAVSGQRARNTVRFVLGLPATRRDVLVGTLRARLTLLVGTLLAVIAVAEVLVIARLGRVYPLALVAWGSYVLLYGTVWTAAVVGVSAATSSRYRTLAVVAAVFFLFNRGVGLWDPVVRPTLALAVTGSTEYRGYAFTADNPVLLQYADHLNPFVALDTVQGALFTVAGYRSMFIDATLPLTCFSLVVLVAFGGSALTLGYRRFERAGL
jgi:ABC-type transport system involved in multi-copper enzyme maturation permease subunit